MHKWPEGKTVHQVTNFHVIRGASDIKVALIDSSVYPAKARP
jgi:S1-C subfamily serine protease